MKIINEIVETLSHARTHRQIVFVSDNANLVIAMYVGHRTTAGLADQKATSVFL